MENLVYVIILTWTAGLAMPLGAWAASIEKIRPDWLEEEVRHTILAFGGGALLGAVALVLVPKGIESLSLANIIFYFALGGLFFFFIDKKLEKSDSPASNLIAMISDFVPESLALGASFASGQKTGLFVAVLIALQNGPESFNSYRELLKSGKVTKKQVLTTLLILSLLGPLTGVTGFLWLKDFPEAISAIMLFSSSGILYLTFQDIAPSSKLKNAWAPALGANAGFLVSLCGSVLTGHS